MKILFDHQIFSMQKYGGISRYHSELMNEFDKMDNVGYQLALKFSDNYYLSSVNNFETFRFLSGFKFRGKSRIISLVNQFYTKYILNKKQYSVFHPTYYHPYFLNNLGNKALVVTVHDMIHELFPEHFSSFDNIVKHKKALVQRADRIITVSENTKNDLIKVYGVDEKKIDVIYLGNSMSFSEENDSNIDLPDNYILFVGVRGRYKNFTNFIRAAALIITNDSDLHVVCAGGGAFSEAELAEFRELGIQNNLMQTDIEDKTLGKIYSHAILFAFPSMYEGFGIPILEAFACSCPIICSNNSSLPEVAQDGAIYFDPNNQSEIQNAIQKLLDDPKLRSELIANGQLRLKAFSWKKTAEKTIRTYISCVD